MNNGVRFTFRTFLVIGSPIPIGYLILKHAPYEYSSKLYNFIDGLSDKMNEPYRLRAKNAFNNLLMNYDIFPHEIKQEDEAIKKRVMGISFNLPFGVSSGYDIESRVT